MKDYKLSEIKAICKENGSGGDCSQCECYNVCDKFTLHYPSEFKIDKTESALATAEQKAFKDGYKKGFDDGKNETAKEVFQELYDRILTLCKESFEKAVSSKDKEFGGANRAFNQIRVEVKNVAKKYGVEVEE